MRLSDLPVIDKTPVRPVPAVYRRSRPAAGLSDQAGVLDGAKAGAPPGGSEARRSGPTPVATGLVGRPLDGATVFGLHQLAEGNVGNSGGGVVTSPLRAAGAYRQAQRGATATAFSHASFPNAPFPYDRAAKILSTVP